MVAAECRPLAFALRAVDDLELLEAAAGADRHAGQRALRKVHRHVRLVTEALVEPVQERAAAGQDDAAVHDVRTELRGRLVERGLDRVDDLGDGILEGMPYLFGAEDDGLGKPGDEVAPPDLGLHLFSHAPRRADLELDLLGRVLPDEQFVLALEVRDDPLVHLVTADAKALADDDAAEGDDGDLGCAAADVDDHVPSRLADREAGADRSRHRLLDQVGLPRAGAEGRLLDGTALDTGHAGRNADDDTWVRKSILVNLLNEVAEHLLGDVEVGDHAVLQRADRGDRPRRAAEHAFCLDTDGVHLAGALVDRDDGRLGEHDSAPTDVHERVRRAQVDGHVAAAEAGQVVKEAHRGLPVY